MKTKSLLSSCLLLLPLVLFGAGCKNSSNPTTTSGTGSSTLAGNVVSYSADGLRILDSSGVSVIVEGTSFSATTDHNGNFSIDGIPAGVYNIIFTRPGFDSMIYPVHHLIGEGTDIFNDPYIIQNSNDSIVFDRVSVLIHDTLSYTKDTNQIIQLDFYAHVVGLDSVRYTSFRMRNSLDTGATQINFDQALYSGPVHINYSFGLDKKLLKSGDTLFFFGTMQFSPQLTRGNYGSQYYHYVTGATSKTTIFKYIVK